MSTVAITGDDTLTIIDHTFHDLADGDYSMLDFPNELSVVKTGKNGNSIYSFNETGRQATLKLRVVRASADDKYLLNLITQFKANPAGFILMYGTFVKKLGVGTGVVSSDTYILSGGVFTKEVAVKSNAEGDTEQSVSIWEMKFTLAPRVIT